MIIEKFDILEHQYKSLRSELFLVGKVDENYIYLIDATGTRSKLEFNNFAAKHYKHKTTEWGCAMSRFKQETLEYQKQIEKEIKLINQTIGAAISYEQKTEHLSE